MGRRRRGGYDWRQEAEKRGASRERRWGRKGEKMKGRGRGGEKKNDEDERMKYEEVERGKKRKTQRSKGE